ncbi:MAG: MarR family transcriptional regulator [Amycolatopsis sp.]|jgi:DNA-binding MarR family transcriptional regulator|uniref:MarR family winged helix-turn-helix transcriptional regulator n=1 Tax=Amycolatopsis sp. TaxID=37632 RepID=UPI002618A9D4|nr:MarR family transcriptional regulator [Amycolatopsis sp.]MCU1681260.1 MarR family transcriptional regulator [Amycolatopsis sp.]
MEEIADSAAKTARDLRVFVSRVRRRAKEVYDTFELTPGQVSVLSRLDQKSDVSASDLAAAERVRPQSMASILAALHERGLIQRRPDPGDGRRQLVSLSQRGRETLHDGRQTRDEWLANALNDRYTEAERDTINDALVLLRRLTHP